ncbi:MAG: class I SAM-dependent methyltransferase [Actinobacteria bacterium]|nr:class I SAM-dependent methyltransferase [Actinomycetota bacterium]
MPDNEHFLQRTACPICGATRSEGIYNAPYNSKSLTDYLKAFYDPQGGVEFAYLDGAEYSLRACQACSGIYQEFIPNEALMHRLYEVWIDPTIVREQHRNKPSDYFAGFAVEIEDVVAWFGGAPADLTFLDFGMGWGQWALMAKAHGVHSSGCELSDEQVQNAHSLGIDVVAWEDIPGGRFDFINTEQVFEHVAEPLKTLQHLKLGLSHRGILKVSVPDAVDIMRRIQILDWQAPIDSSASLNPVAPLEHINFFQRESIHAMAQLAGMHEIALPRRVSGSGASAVPRSAKESAKRLLRPAYRRLRPAPSTGNYVFLRAD